MFSIKCEQCQSEFLARRRIDCYCSDACRAEGAARKARKRTREWREANHEYYLKALMEWRQANSERARSCVTEWHKANPEKRREHCATWRKAHAEEIKVSKLEWHKRDPNRARMYQQARRAKKAANGGSFTTAEWQSLKQRYEFRCLCCSRTEPDIELTMDHIVPVTQGGSNDISNIQPLCLTCNLSKGTKTRDYRST
jgi:5-methylcytosine-specific restriction endonuclease McrA